MKNKDCQSKSRHILETFHEGHFVHYLNEIFFVFISQTFVVKEFLRFFSNYLFLLKIQEFDEQIPLNLVIFLHNP